MNRIRAIVVNRYIHVPAPDDLPDGTEVIIQPVSATGRTGLDETEWDDSPEGIEAWLREYESLEPLIFTNEELARLEADRKARKEWEKKHSFERGDKLAKLWE